MALRTTVAFTFIVLLLSTATVRAGGAITWTLTGGPTGGLVSALVAAPNAPGVLFAGTNGGVFLTRDDGAHWQLASSGLPDDRAITALAISPDATTVFAGTRAGVYRTRDAGAHWTPSDAQFADQSILFLLIDPQAPNIIYAGTTTTLLKSENNGDTWSDAGADLRPVAVYALALSPDSMVLYAATGAGIFASRDRGARWQLSSEGLPEGARPQALATTARGFLAGTTQGLFRSREGKTWSAVSDVGSGVLVRPIFSDPRQPDRVFAVTAPGLAKSSDGGGTWTMLPNVFGDAPFVSLAFGDKNALYAGSARGAWKSSDDGATWQPLNTGLVSTSVHALLLAPNNPDTLLAATRFGLWLSPDRGATWQAARGLSDPYVLALAVDPATPRLVYAGTWGSAFFVSNDGGANFSRVTENLASHAPIGSLIALRANVTILYAGTLGNGLFRSVDGGKTWGPQSAGLASNARVTALAFIPPAALFAGTDRGLYRLDLSKPNATWQSMTPALPADEVRAVVVEARQPQALFVLFTASGLYRSDDNGTRWQQVVERGKKGFATRARFQAFALNPSLPDVLYIGTDSGMYRSEDAGASWSGANDGLLPGTDVQAIAVDPQSAQNVFAGTNGSGVVRGVDQLPVSAAPWYTGGLLGVIVLAVLGIVAISWRTRFSSAAQERVWARDWPAWESAITHALWTFGQANETNLKVPRRRLVRALQRYQEQCPDDALTLQAAPVALKLDTYLPAQKFFSHWKAAWETVGSADAFKVITSQMVDQLCALLGFTRVEERAYKWLIGYVVRAPALRLKIPSRFPIIFIAKHEVGEEDVSALRDLMGILTMTSYFALIVDLRDAPSADARQSLKHLVRQAIHDFIVLDGSDIRRLLAARDHARRLVELILDQVDLTVVSPYVTSGPVPANMFFGREHELKTIVRTIRDANFAIVGGRKIGKTSVLARVYRLLQEVPECQPYYLDCQAIHSHPDLFQAIDTMWKAPLSTPTAEGFRQMAAELSAQHSGRTLVMLFDEIDTLLQYDIAQGQHLFQIFRALSQEGHVRYIFCGEKLLHAALHDSRLVFFNFCNVLTLSYLTPDEARRVVLEPMHEMGVALEDEPALADHIVALTAGHPNIVQYVCQKLIERINVRRARVITRADVDAVSQSPQFAEYFTEVAWSNANALERLLTLLVLDHPEVTANEMADMLHAYDLQIAPAQLERALNGLCLYSIMCQDGSKYTFAAPALPQVLRRSRDRSGLIPSLVAEIQQMPESLDALL